MTSNTRAPQMPAVTVSWIWLAFAILAAIFAGIMVTIDARLIVLPAIPPLLYALVMSPAFRLGFVVFGGILTLQGGDGINAPKLVYLAGATFSVCIALMFPSRRVSLLPPSISKRLMAWSVLWAALILFSSIVALQQSLPLIDWLRGAIPYALFASVPIIALDTALGSPVNQVARVKRKVTWFFVAAGSVTAVSWAVSWAARRGLGVEGFDRLFLWSFLLPAALFCYATAAAFHRQEGRLGWVALATAIFALFALTGTRSTVFFLVGPLVLFISNGFTSFRKSASLIASGIIPSVIVSAVALWTASYLQYDLDNVVERFTGLASLESMLATDTSVQERLQQTELARQAFSSSPLLGVSPGYRFEWFTSYNVTKSSINIDSPLAFPAQFGVVGILVSVVTLVLLISSIRASRSQESDGRVEVDAIKAFIGAVIASIAMGSPFEDKGFSFALAHLLVLFLLSIEIDGIKTAEFQEQPNTGTGA